MDLALSPEQEELRRSARAFLAARCPARVVRRLRAPVSDGEAIDLLRGACRLGWSGLALPEAVGGSGGSLLDQAVLAEELGGALFPTILSSSVAAALAITAATTTELAATLLPAILDGSSPAAMCWPSTQTAPVTLAGQEGNQVLEGDAGLVVDGMTAALLVVAARMPAGEVRLVVTDTDQPAVERRRRATVDGARHARVSFRSAPVRPDYILGGSPEGTWRRARQQVTALHCAEMVGVAAAALAMTTAYVTERHQFGRPIGSFQAVQHHVADMAMVLDAARLAAYQAAWCAGSGGDASRPVAVAKVAANRAATEVTLMAHQLHGGIGFSVEHDLHLFSDRAAADVLRLGTTDEHLQRIGEGLATGLR